MSLPVILIQGAAAFLSTNIDDVFILAVFFSLGTMTAFDICAGQYLGFIALVAASLAGSLTGTFFAPEIIGLLGLFPVYIGLRAGFRLFKKTDTEEIIPAQKQPGKGILFVATVTMANGGDNIGVYVPLFASLSTAHIIITLAVFMALVPALLITGYFATKHPVVSNPIKKYANIITPVILVGLGFYIMHESGTLAGLLSK
jgi:cadmium resistance protein CadD (predicted permease)